MTSRVATSKPSIGIVGKGFVGTTIANYYLERGFNVRSFDIKGNCDPMSTVADQDIVFIAIMLPDNGLSEKDRDNLDEILAHLPLGRIAVIKSTVVPGTTRRLQNENPDLKLFFNPEFLTESTAEEDFCHPPFAILGVTKESNQPEIVEILQGILPPASPDKTFIIGASEAEMLKMVRNSYLALKLTAFNQMFDICSKSGVDYDTVRMVLSKDEWVGDSHNIIWHKGKRGFSGKCLPKDLHNLVRYCMEEYIPASLFYQAETLNGVYLSQRKEKEGGNLG